MWTLVEKIDQIADVDTKNCVLLKSRREGEGESQFKHTKKGTKIPFCRVYISSNYGKQM